MPNALVIVWRECLEAMLVIGILSAWVGRRGTGGRWALWAGVAAGAVLALALAALMQGALGTLSDHAQEIFQALLILFSAALMTHMVLWMRRHGRGLRFLPPHQVLRASAALLLLFAAGLVVAGTDRLIGLEWLAPGPDPLWDTSAWLDDGAGAGKLLADLLGYRARPAGAVVLACAGYWALMAALRWWPARSRVPEAP